MTDPNYSNGVEIVGTVDRPSRRVTDLVAAAGLLALLVSLSYVCLS